jgi:hypothetical protein
LQCLASNQYPEQSHRLSSSPAYGEPFSRLSSMRLKNKNADVIIGNVGIFRTI